MGNNLIILTVFSIITLLILRGYMSVGIRLFQTKNERKRYVSNVSKMDRWFFLTAPKVISDKYSRYEKRTIHYSSMAKTYRIVNCVNHATLVVELIFILSFSLGFVEESLLNIVCVTYFVMAYFSFGVLAVVEFKANKRFHRSRYSGKS